MDISLYIHIPFCSKKCPYCHFFVLPYRQKYVEIFHEAFLREWEQKRFLLQNKNIVSVYFGGGTPTLYPLEYLQEMLLLIHKENIAADCEFTLEANPENVSEEYFIRLREMGINRLSIGAQSLEDDLLQILGRNHDAKRTKKAIFSAKQAGIENISIDLLFDVPHQTLQNFSHTFKQVKELPITHISLYNLTFEPHTVFFKKKKSLQPFLPDPESSLQLWNMAEQEMEKMGFQRYEISAFAKEGKISRHNTGYWTARPFLGYGPSAFSYWEKKRFSNHAHLLRYYNALQQGTSPIAFEEQLPYPDAILELLCIHLRLLEGIVEKEWALPQKTQEVLHSLQKEGLMVKKGENLALSQKGVLFYDTVATEIISSNELP